MDIGYKFSWNFILSGFLYAQKEFINFLIVIFYTQTINACSRNSNFDKWKF